MMSPVPIDRAFLQAHRLPDIASGAGKDERGTVLIVAGSREVPGAALLAAEAAMRAGAGKLQIATVRSVALQLALAIPEARVIALPETASGEIDPASASRLHDGLGRANAVLIGPGMLDEDAARALTLGLLPFAATASIVLDAAAMTAMRSETTALRACGSRLVITPHPGEMATFLGMDREAVLADPVSAGRRAAELIEGVVVTKGASTFICAQADLCSCEGGGVV